MTARRHDPAIRFDSRKAATNPRKQGITFEEAASVFEDDLSAYTDVDAEHSDNDLRSSPSELSIVANCSTFLTTNAKAE